MKLRWTARAVGDLARLHDFLAAVAPASAARVAGELARAPDRLLNFPRIGERLDAYSPREVRRLIVGTYEIRYEICDMIIVILRVWHGRENRPSKPET